MHATDGQNSEGRARNSEAIIGTRFISTRVFMGLKLLSFGILSTDFRRAAANRVAYFALIVHGDLSDDPVAFWE